MKKKKLRYHYDREADVMYFYFDRPRRAKTIELDNDFLLRLDPTTGTTVGMNEMGSVRDSASRAR